MYTHNQVEAVVKELRTKIAEGNITEYELVILVLILEKTKKINIKQVSEILIKVVKDTKKILETLETARSVITDSIINEIIKEVD
jgi:hypothetical protein